MTFTEFLQSYKKENDWDNLKYDLDFTVQHLNDSPKPQQLIFRALNKTQLKLLIKYFSRLIGFNVTDVTQAMNEKIVARIVLKDYMDYTNNAVLAHGDKKSYLKLLERDLRVYVSQVDTLPFDPD